MMQGTRPRPAFRNPLGFALILLSGLTPGPVPLAAADQPYDEYVRSRIDEGLDTASTGSVAKRVQGAVQASLYIPFPDDTEKGKRASPEYWSFVSDRIRAWLENEKEPWVRYYLVEALVRLDEESDLPYILVFLEDEDPTLRKLVAEAASRHPSEEVEQRLVSLYSKQQNWWVKAAFLTAMGDQTGTRSLDLLHHALGDPVRDIRAAASSALASRPDPRNVEPLRAAMGSGDLLGEDSPLRALVAIGGDAAFDALKEGAASPYPCDRAQAARALGDFSSAETTDLLTGLLHDPNPAASRSAAEALIALGTPQTAEQALLYLAQYPQESLEELQRGQDPVFEALRGMRDKGVDLSRACDTLMARSDPDSDQACALRILGDEIRRRETEDLYVIWSSADVHSAVYSRYNADAREVAPASGGRRTAGWEDAPFTRNGGTKAYMGRGTQVTVQAAAVYRGETWLEVREGPYGENLWVKEEDLRPVSPREVLERANHSGAKASE